MNPILKKILDRANVTGRDQLSLDEKATYDKIVEDLKTRTEPRTPQDWENFLQEELEKLIESFNPDDSQKKKDFLWHQIFLTQKFLVFLKRPKQEEQQIKKQYKV